MRIAYRYDARVGPEGKLELKVPVAPGTPVEVIVLAESDRFHDLLCAAATSVTFRDNPDDDEWDNL